MTEAEWVVCRNPVKMLHYLFCNSSNAQVRDYFSFEVELIETDGRRLQTSERKLRLFYSACCRRVLNLVPVLDFNPLIEVAERFADGLTSEEDLATARNSTKAILQQCRSDRREVDTWVALAVQSCLEEVWANGPQATVQAALAVSEVRKSAPIDGNLPLDQSECDEQARILRCVFGAIPFRPMIATVAWVLFCKNRAVIDLAKDIYHNCTFEHLPILGDALEKAGYDFPEILEHCRESGPHVRGCWVVDAVLGKE
jgi:hypothetical protein